MTLSSYLTTSRTLNSHKPNNARKKFSSCSFTVIGSHKKPGLSTCWGYFALKHPRFSPLVLVCFIKAHNSPAHVLTWERLRVRVRIRGR